MKARLGIHPYNGLSLLHHSPSLGQREGYAYIGRATINMLDAAMEAIEDLDEGGPIGRALDIGTGGGYGPKVVAERVGSSLGTDISQELVEFATASAVASRVPNVEYKLSDICADVSGEFDLIIANPPQNITDPSRQWAGTHDRGGSPRARDSWSNTQRIVGSSQRTRSHGGLFLCAGYQQSLQCG